MKRTLSRCSSLLVAMMFLACSSFAQLQTWTADLSLNQGKDAVQFTMVGTAPWDTLGATIPVYAIPLLVTFSGKQVCNCQPCSYDALSKLSGGETVLDSALASPIFQPVVDFVQGDVDLGTVQYVDAFRRGDFWSYVSTSNNHLTLGTPTILPEQTINITSEFDGSTQPSSSWGGCIGNLQEGVPEAAAVSIINSLNQTQLQALSPNALVILLTNEVMEAGSGGHHFPVTAYFNGEPQTYTVVLGVYNSYTDCGTQLCYGQDVADLGHELAEWADDPYDNNYMPDICTKSLYEVGDPFEDQLYYCSFPVNGFTYHLQDLAFTSWFGQSPNYSVNGWYSLQNEGGSGCYKETTHQCVPGGGTTPQRR